MYLGHFGLNEAPFRITPHTEFFFSGANRGATLEALLYAIAHDEGIVKVTGEVGSGKTMLCRVLVERLPKSIETIYLATPSVSRDEILHVIAADLQVESQGARLTILLRALQDRLINLYEAGRRVVVLIDEAHAMPLETLEEVRLLSNLESNRHKLLQMVLFGQPELNAHLALPSMRQLKERITHTFKLEPLVRSDVESYIDFRMRAAGYRGPNVFAPQAMQVIAQSSLGLTRRINILADKALLAAFADGAHQVSVKHARAAVRDSEYGTERRLLGKWWVLASGLAAGLAIGFSVHFLYPSRTEKMAMPAASLAPASPASVVASTPADAVPASAQSAADSGPRAGKVSAADGAAMLTTGSADPASASDKPSPPPSGKLLQERFGATQQWLKTAPPGSWTIQLLTVSAGEAPKIERFLEQATKLVSIEDLHVYSVKVQGRQHYGVTYGNYPTLEDTITAMGVLPASFKSRGPFHRSIALMRRQNQE